MTIGEKIRELRKGANLTQEALAAALVVKLQGTKMPGFLVGRFAMTCCENDIQFLSVYCQNNMKFKNKAWYHVRAKVVCVDASIYGEPSGELLPALEVLELNPADKPEQEVVTF